MDGLPSQRMLFCQFVWRTVIAIYPEEFFAIRYTFLSELVDFGRRCCSLSQWPIQSVKNKAEVKHYGDFFCQFLMPRNVNPPFLDKVEWGIRIYAGLPAFGLSK